MTEGASGFLALRSKPCPLHHPGDLPGRRVGSFDLVRLLLTKGPRDAHPIHVYVE